MTLPTLAPASARPASAIDKFSSGRRIKSAYRDALYRPVFQGLAAYRAAQLAGGTSVIWVTPDHPLFLKLHLNTHNTLPLASLPPYPLVREDLTDEDLLKEARHWSQFNVRLPRKRLLPAPYRDLSDEARLEWFHHATKLNGPCTFFTVHLDAEIASMARTKPAAASWLQDRITKRLKAQLGSCPLYWFVIEQGELGGLHLHGEIGVDGDDVLAAVRKAFRLAAGEWEEVRQHQAHTRPDANLLGSSYAAKDAIWMKPSSLPYLSRPISGSWYAATNDLRRRADRLYSECREHVLALLPAIKAQANASL